MNKIARFLYGSEPLEIVFDVPMDIAMERLSSRVNRTYFSQLRSQRMVGYVEADEVAIQRVIPMVQNSFKPVFHGAFEAEENQTSLKGILRFHRIVQVFMTLWFLFVALFFVQSLIEFTFSDAGDWFALLLSLAMLAGGVFIVILGKWFSRNDKVWLTKAITAAIYEE
jgi:hypothetical protein